MAATQIQTTSNTGAANMEGGFGLPGSDRPGTPSLSDTKNPLLTPPPVGGGVDEPTDGIDPPNNDPEVGTSDQGASQPSPTGSGSKEEVPSKHGKVNTRDHRSDDAYWKGLLDAGNYDAILDAAASGNKSAKEWLKKPENSLALQRQMQLDSMLQQTLSNVSRTLHDMAMASVRNIRA